MGLLRATLRPCCGAEEKLYGRPHAMEGEGGLVGCHVGILCTSWGCELGTCMGLRAGCKGLRAGCMGLRARRMGMQPRRIGLVTGSSPPSHCCF